MGSHVNSICNSVELPTLTDLDPRADALERPTLTEDLQKVYLNNDPNKFTYVGTTLSSEEKASFQKFLQQHADLFAWTPVDMPGISPSVISHKLALNPSFRPIAQKKRNLGLEKKQASLEETKKLINAGFIQEIHFTTWLVNVVIVKNHNVMPFGLKNARATYQRLMDKVFTDQIGKNLEVFVDDMVAKTKLGHSHLDYLLEIFNQIWQYNMRLNPEKCAFGIQGGKFLGFMLTNRGIKANPKKC
nr:uncharacterized protein LOC114927415 [Arachis hypogaea]